MYGGFEFSRVEDGRLDELGGDHVGVNVGGGAAVLEVALACPIHVTADADRRATVGNTPGELVDGGSLVETSQTTLVSSTVHSDVLLVFLGQLLNGLLDDLQAAVVAHGLSAVVAVSASSVPVTGNRLGVERHDHVEVLTKAVQKVPRQPHVISGLDALTGTDLELPLARHDLSIDARDLDASIHAGAVVRLHDVATEHVVGTNSAVVGALGTRVAILGPSEGPLVLGE
mmetsp:Transcript_43905/g.110679  ORF Transcript_43905/g.110679 Transcript_43905/m.110679 type:complete len:229 (+) Transcript_43905:48-734(+)